MIGRWKCTLTEFIAEDFAHLDDVFFSYLFIEAIIKNNYNMLALFYVNE